MLQFVVENNVFLMCTVKILRDTSHLFLKGNFKIIFS